MRRSASPITPCGQRGRRWPSRLPSIGSPPTAPSGRGFRIGINSGPALVGNIGSDELRNFAAIGDTTNLAARLQTFASPGQVVLGARTRELLGTAALVRPLGDLELKGKSSGTTAFELLGLRPG